tara:strand:- start:454 stop:834 length:381 start_codon:yes stop_codon:yes gene_type:complete
MSEDWDEIAAEVAEALGDVGMICTLRRKSSTQTKPWVEGVLGDDLYELSVVQTLRQVKDKFGTFIGEVKTVLIANANGEVPLKSDRVALNTRKDDVTVNTKFLSVSLVDTISPAGVPVSHEITLEN